MHHYVYKIFTDTGKFYYGRHSTLNMDDGYMGSGKWVRSIRDKSILQKDVVEVCENYEQLLMREQYWISHNIGHPNCMNFNNNPIGFASGDLNPAKRPEMRQKLSEKMKSELNPSKRDDVRQKKSEMMIGRPNGFRGKTHSDESRKNMSDGRTGITITDEGRQKLSQSRKRQYDAGERAAPSFTGHRHTPETRELQKQIALSREKHSCPHCGKRVDRGNYSRWHGDKCKHKGTH